jgi:glycosyltransferase involved in cell wall biosynthesis
VAAKQMTPDIVSGESEDGSDLSIVIPAHNEEHGISVTLKSLIESLPRAEIIVVDDGSTDATAAVALQFPGITVLSHRANRGYGGALKTGMRVATRPFVAWFDADNEHRVSDLAIMVKRCREERLVAVLAERRNSGRSKTREAGKWLIRMLMRSFNIPATRDVNCGLRVFDRATIESYLPLLPNTYSASMTSTFILLERGYPLVFQPIDLNARIGVSKVRLRDGFRAFWLILRLVMLFAPFRIFARLGLPLIGLGAVYGISIALIQGAGIPTASVIAIISGFLMILFGLLADQISQMRLTAHDTASFTVLVPDNAKAANAKAAPAPKKLSAKKPSTNKKA